MTPENVLPVSGLTVENYYELEAAIFSGAQSVSYSHPGGSKNVTYRSTDEMLKLLRLLAGRLGMGAGSRRRTVASFSKGYSPAPCLHLEEGSECLPFHQDGRCCP
jgi:hypothetical protein